MTQINRRGLVIPMSAVWRLTLGLHFFGAPLDLSREAIYTMGFFGFWGLGIASSALTLFLERSSTD